MQEQEAHKARQETDRPCQACHERYAWDLLRESYVRENTAHENILQLREKLCEVNMALKDSQLALAHCEAALTSSWENLNSECLAHQACRGELRDATTLVRQAVGAATRSGHTADSLATEVIELRAALHASQVLQATRPPANAPSMVHDVAGSAPSQRPTRYTSFPGAQQHQISAATIKTPGGSDEAQDRGCSEKNPAKRARA
jgi:hypothetical protein